MKLSKEVKTVNKDNSPQLDVNKVKQEFTYFGEPYGLIVNTKDRYFKSQGVGRSKSFNK